MHILVFTMLLSVSILRGNSFRQRSFRLWSSVGTLGKSPDGIIEYGIPLNVYIDSDIIKYLRLKSSERKARILLPKHLNLDEITISSMQAIIEKKLPHISNQNYILRYSTQGIVPKKIDSNEELHAVFKSAKPIQFYVQSNPCVFPPPANNQFYLQDMQDPLETKSYTMVSFYRFIPISDPEGFSSELFNLWKPFKVFGRVYVAKEGINAQMSIPSNILHNFRQACESLEVFKGLYLNIDHEMNKDEFYNNKPFKALHIRVRDQIVADGFDYSLDWEKAGKEVHAEDWNKGLTNPDTIVLDCRNSYESDVGVFEKAIPLNTTFFRESWDALEEVLASVPKDKPIMTYCTGGIRCVKINAFLEQKLGFTNVSRLAGGIISYVKELQEIDGNEPENTESIQLSRHVEESKFKGVNYVFDERMGARITKDVLTACETCGEPHDIFTNCANTNCHIRFIQCRKCNGEYNGCCSKACQADFDETSRASDMNKNMMPRARSSKIRTGMPNNIEGDRINNIEGHPSLNSSSVSMEQFSALTEYCERYSAPEPPLLKSLRERTLNEFNSGASRMISGHLQGRLLAILAKITKAKAVLELGTFTGYSALCFAEGVASDGTVLTTDVDSNSVGYAKEYYNLSPDGYKIDQRLQPAQDMINECYEKNYKFDIVFIDADKKLYLDYLKQILGDSTGNSQTLLNDGALVVVDNTLWKGLVLEQVEDLKESSPDPAEFGKVDRMRDIAAKMHEFNEYVAHSSELDSVLLPLRDGLTILRYKGS